jgi:hypothetical protein
VNPINEPEPEPESEPENGPGAGSGSFTGSGCVRGSRYDAVLAGRAEGGRALAGRVDRPAPLG